MTRVTAAVMMAISVALSTLIFWNTIAIADDADYIRSWHAIPEDKQPIAAVTIIFKEVLKLWRDPVKIPDQNMSYIGAAKIIKTPDSTCTYELQLPMGRGVGATISFDRLLNEISVLPEGSIDVWTIRIEGKGDAICVNSNNQVGQYPPGNACYHTLGLIETSSERAKFFVDSLRFVYSHICSPLEVTPF